MNVGACGRYFIIKIKPDRASDFHHFSFIFYHCVEMQTARQTPNLSNQQKSPSSVIIREERNFYVIREVVICFIPRPAP